MLLDETNEETVENKDHMEKFLERFYLMKQLSIFVKEEIDLEIPNTMMII